MQDSNTLGSMRLPLQALMKHLFQEGANQNNVDQRNLIHLVQNTIQDILQAEAIETGVVLKSIIEVIRLSLHAISLEEKLQRALECLLNVPSLNGLDKGSIFLVDSKNRQLRLVAWKNLSEVQRNLCKTVTFGHCLCGRFMEMGQPVLFKSVIDADHDTLFPDITPHGHSIFKVTSLDSEQIILLVNLYVVDQCKEDPRNKLFIEAMSMAFSVLYTLHMNYEQLNKNAFEDPLTHIANRRLFQDRLDQAIQKANRYNTSFMVMALGVDRFSRINESLGRAVGDEVLKKLSKRLNSILRAGDTLAKSDGDEFLLLFAIQDAREIMPPVRRIQKIVSELPISIENQEIQIELSIGISLYPEDQNQLLEKAKFALKSAKEQGGGGFKLFSNEAHQKTQNLINLERDLRIAVKNEEILVYYQPKISLLTMKIIGFEALARWPDMKNAGRMKAFPDQFIPLAEETGLILPLGRHILDVACHDLKQWYDMGYQDLYVAVNLSARQFIDPFLIENLIQSLSQSGLPAHLLEIEITESYVMNDPKKAKEILESLKSLGVKISLDDFGTGYSSLSHLQMFPFDRLKIDRSFVMELHSSQASTGIVQAIFQLARILRMQVTAEGVETEAQQALLQEIGCHDVQGWLYSKAAPAEEIPMLLKKYNG
ncbi:MAG: EAL domain-containing protein [Magnetococcus sp. DMHC-6]